MKELTNVERADIVSLFISSFSSLIIRIPKMRDPFTHEVSYWIDVDLRKIKEQREYWFYPLMTTVKILF